VGRRVLIRNDDLRNSIADALQYISYFHPPQFIRHLAAAFEIEESLPAKEAMGQILTNSWMSALGRRPFCQDTGSVEILLRLGAGIQLAPDTDLQAVVDAGVREAYTHSANPLRASIVTDPLFARTNTGDNTPAVLMTEVVPGTTLDVVACAKGGGAENKARFAVLNPSDSVIDWILESVAGMGAGWCPPGVLGIGVGGTAQKAMTLAKHALFEPLDMIELRHRGPNSAEEQFRLEVYERVNALGIGAQGVGGLTTVLDVKLRTFPSHASALPVALIPNCAATRVIRFSLDGSGPANLEPPSMDVWPGEVWQTRSDAARRVNLDLLTREEIASWRCGDTLLLSGRMLTGRDAAHKRMSDLLQRGEKLPVSLKGRTLYYVGPVGAVGNEIVGPAGPTTATRMDKFTDALLEQTGLLATIGKAERGPDTCEAIRRHGSAYLMAVGGAAYLVSKAIKQAQMVAFPELGMEAMHEFTVSDMPVTVAVDATGTSIHEMGPRQWRREAVVTWGRRAGTGT
jgi:fumarate hydratase class I